MSSQFNDVGGVLSGIRSFFYSNVVGYVGLDAESFNNTVESFDPVIMQFIREGGTNRLFWFTAKKERTVEAYAMDDAASISHSTTLSTISTLSTANSSYDQDASSASSGSTTSSAAAVQSIVVTSDKLHSLSRYNCVYFIRDPEDLCLITEKNICDKVFVGSIRGNENGETDVLETLHEDLKHLFFPALEERTDYGELTESQPGWKPSNVTEISDFIQKSHQYQNQLKRISDNMKQTVTLTKPTRRFCIDFNHKAFGKAAQKREVIECYEVTLYHWIREVKKLLSQGMLPAIESGSAADNMAKFGDDSGPELELEYWKKRTAQLNHITDNLQFKGNKIVVGVLMMAGARTQQVLSEWKEVEAKVIEAANESKDNSKYLGTLERFAEPLFTGTASLHAIKQVIPAIMNVIRMVHSIRCRRYLERNGEIWDQDATSAIEDLKACTELKETYVFHFRQTKGEMAANIFGPQFSFSEASVFGRFDLFCVRLTKVIDIMHVTRQFGRLAAANIDNSKQLCIQYDTILSDLREQSGDYLEARNREFDAVYQDYKVRVQELSTELVVFLNNCFLTVTNTAKALHLLRMFKAVINNNHISKLLEEKHGSIFVSYGRDLEHIKTLYEKHKEDPPCDRNSPPVAGAISWVRQLLRKIENPMKVFQETSHLLMSREARRIISTFNKVAKTLVTYESRWQRAWYQQVSEHALAGMQMPLLVCDEHTKKVYVNFDCEVRKVIHEVEYMTKLCLPVPPEARSLYSQKNTLFRYNEELTYMISRYYAVVQSTNPKCHSIITPTINELNIYINPGLVQLTWRSLNIGLYIRSVFDAIQNVETMSKRVNNVFRYRIDRSLQIVENTSFICLAATNDGDEGVSDGQAYSIQELINAQQTYAHSISQQMNVLNCEIASSVREVVNIITSGYSEDDMQSVTPAIAELFSFFEHSLFQALLQAMQQSVVYLKRRITGTASDAFIHPSPVVFNVELVIKFRSVDFSPSLEDLQKCLNRMARSILESARGIYRWKQDGKSPQSYDVVEHQSAILRTEAATRSAEADVQILEKVLAHDSSDEGDQDTAPRSRLKSLFLRIGKNRRMTKVFLQLTGSVSGLQSQLSTFLQQFGQFGTLLRGNRADVIETFTMNQQNQQSKNFDDYEENITSFYNMEKTIAMLPNSHVIGCIHIDMSKLKSYLTQEAAAWKAAYGSALNGMVKLKMDNLVHNMEDIQAKLSRTVHDLSDVNRIMSVISRLRADESEIDMKLLPIVNAYDILYRYNIKVTKEEQDQVDRIGFQWNDLVTQSRSIMDHLQGDCPKFRGVLLHDVSQFNSQIRTFKSDYDRNGPMVDHIEPRLAVERLKVFKIQFVECKRKLLDFQMGENLFGLPITRYPEVDQIEKELRLLGKLYDLYTEVLTSKALLEEKPWIELNIDKVKQTIKQFHERVKKMPAALRDWLGYKELRGIIDELLDTVPILEQLLSKCICERHWQQLSSLTGCTLNPKLQEFRLRHIMEAKLVNNKTEVEEIIAAAQKEFELEAKLLKIKEEWLDKEFQLAPFKNRGLVTLKSDTTSELISKVEEGQTTLTSLLCSRFNAPFKKDIMLWISKLTATQECISEWLEVQHLWIYLEAVFSSSDICKEMPAEVKRFSNIDRQWIKIMKSVAETPKVLKLCIQGDMLSNLLPHLRLYLDMCQKSLSGYLLKKRNAQPRFYFVSNAQLLEILGQASNPSTVQQYLPSITNNIYELHFSKDEPASITSLSSAEGEVIQLDSPVSTSYDVMEWLHNLLAEQQHTLKMQTHRMVSDLSSFEGHIQVSSLNDLVEEYSAQVSLLGIQLMWTADCEFALTVQKTEKGIMTSKVRKHKQIQEHFISKTRLQLQPRERTCIEALLTIQIHQFDVLLLLQRSCKKIRSAADFEWLKHVRFYWKVDRDTCQASVTDTDFDYAFEYLGCVERLVVTELTDRIYISSAQAIGMGYGGNPIGPAGTGKTETVKDMGRSFGRFVIVMNCSDQMGIGTMANMFKGIAMSGCWCGFDEINRVDTKILSVVAAQVACVLHGKRNRQAEVTFPDGAFIKLDSMASIFVTLNPGGKGYEGRNELPENMKALFRSIAVVVPDSQSIMRVRLAASGFLDCITLARKFQSLYSLCKQQLGACNHYDFGLRSVLAVLRRCGEDLRGCCTRRTSITTTPVIKEDAALERSVLVRVLREMNLSKLVEEDALLFSDLLNDIFPGERCDPQQSPLLRNVRRELSNLDYSPAPEWEAKILQTYEQSKARHGICVMGPSATGKSSALKVLIAAMNLEFPQRTIYLNPKTLSVTEMYGRYDRQTGDWCDGVFTTLWRKSSRRQRNHIGSWFILDGPVDPHWIESLNTVLDDTKLLTLPNNERLSLPKNLLLVFEVLSLSQASPATVSRLGTIYFSSGCLSWNALLTSWLAKYKHILRSGGSTISDLYDALVPQLLSVVSQDCNHTIKLTDSQLILNSLKLMEGFFTDSQSKSNIHNQSTLSRITLFGILWGIAGVLETTCRERVWEFAKHHKSVIDLQCDPDGLFTNHSIFDLYIDPHTSSWATWNASSLISATPQNVPHHEVFVLTPESMQLHYVIQMASKRLQNVVNFKRNVLVIGKSGIGKTSSILNHLRRRGEETGGSFLSRILALSSVSGPVGLQNSIQSFVERISGFNWGPPPGTTLDIFLDDLSMPAANHWGDNPTLELIRQVLDYGFFYSRNRLETADKIILTSTQFIAACDHPTGEKQVPTRLCQHFFIVNSILPPPPSLDMIYGTILERHFGTTSHINILSQLVPVTRLLWQDIIAKLIPIPGKEQYTFTIRDLSRVTLGLIMAHPDVLSTQLDVLLLYEHELRRVFCDKLEETDSNWVTMEYTKRIEQLFKESAGYLKGDSNLWAHFLREDIEDDGEIIVQPPYYERADSELEIRFRLQRIIERYNEANPKSSFNLLLFDYAVRRVVRISRCLQTPSTSVLLLGIPGSGRRSLTGLAAYAMGHKFFELPLGNYSYQSFIDDLRLLHKLAAITQPVTLLVSEHHLTKDFILELVNTLLTTGEIVGLHQKDDLELLYDDLIPFVKKESPSNADLHSCYRSRVRNNIHIVLHCSAGLGGFGNSIFKQKLRFPAMLNKCVLILFPTWPADALVTTAIEHFGDLSPSTTSVLKQVGKVQKTKDTKSVLANHAARIHDFTQILAARYYKETKRQVVIPPGDFFQYLEIYTTSYSEKSNTITERQNSIHNGINVLAQARVDITDMKRSLKKKQLVLDRAAQELEILLKDIKVQADVAAEQTATVEDTRNTLAQQAAKVSLEKDEAQLQLAAAEPAMKAAENALNTIRPDDIATLKRLPNPPPLIRRILDGVLLLRSFPVDFPAGWETDSSGNRVLKPSWTQGKAMATDFRFLQHLVDFPKDSVNDEHCELLAPYLGMEDFTVERARSACGSLAGLCTWIRMITIYHSFAKAIAPKRQRLTIAETQLYKAKILLRKSEEELAQKQAALDEMRSKFQRALDEKTILQTDAETTKRRLLTAQSLISGLDGERERWLSQTTANTELQKRLLGDTARLAAFQCYCPPFNQKYRRMILGEVESDFDDLCLPYTSASFSEALIPQELKRTWVLEGLPTDEQSMQNARLVTQSIRKVLIIDPQGQGIKWLTNMSAKRGKVYKTSVKKADWLKTVIQAAREGKPVIVTEIHRAIPSALSNLIDKNYNTATLIDGTKVQLVLLEDTEAEVVEGFEIYLVSSMERNPTFHPDVFTKLTVVDFTVTIQGLTEQLLSAVVIYEKPSLEDDRLSILEEMLSCESVLSNCEQELLKRLLLQEGTRLLDDGGLMEVLSATKEKSNEIADRLVGCTDSNNKIAQARDQYLEIAVRGALLYSTIADLSEIQHMYHVSLHQFTVEFEAAMQRAPLNPYPPKRILNILGSVTKHVHTCMLRGYYSSEKHIFSVLVVLYIQQHADIITSEEVGCLLKSPPSAKDHPILWLGIEENEYLKMLEKEVKALSHITSNILHYEQEWKSWCQQQAPESVALPGIEDHTKPFHQILIINALRPDRTRTACDKWVASFLRMREDSQSKHVDSHSGSSNRHTKSKLPPPLIDCSENEFDFVSHISPTVPILCLLSAGVDSHSTIDILSKKHRVIVTQVSMGESQEPLALKSVQQALSDGGWVVLQNVHLNLHFISDLTEFLSTYSGAVSPMCRIWITCLPHPEFPISTLHSCVKIALEPPRGVKLSLHKSFQYINQDQLDSIKQREWRLLLFTLCFFHSAVVQRNRYSSMGWSTPYEFSHHDLVASTSFLYNYLFTDIKKGVSWPTLQYMIADVQYGGRVTNHNDHRILLAYAERWLRDDIFDSHCSYTFYPGYVVRDFVTVGEYKKYISSLPPYDTPEMLGMHCVAEISVNRTTSKQFLSVLSSLRLTNTRETTPTPRDTDTTIKICKEISEKFATSLEQNLVRDCLKKLGCNPLGIFLRREISLMQKVIVQVVHSCTTVQKVLSGMEAETITTSAVEEKLLRGQIPDSWKKFSWNSDSLRAWVMHGMLRIDQLVQWLQKGTPRCYWIPGFFHPQSLIASVKQEYVRPHLSSISLDAVYTRIRLTKHVSPEALHLHTSSEEGCHYFYGLYLVSAAWERTSNLVVDPPNRQTYNPLPVIKLVCINACPPETKHFQCPVFRSIHSSCGTPLFSIGIETDQPTDVWVLRGTTAVCDTTDSAD